MYRQPENSNRVKSMKNKFEDLNDSSNTQKNNDKIKKTHVQNKISSKPPVVLINTKISEKLAQKTENNNDLKRNSNNSKENNIKIDRKNRTMKSEDTFKNKNKFEEKTNGKKDFSDINKKELCNAPPLNLTRQLNDPSKKGCIKRTPAFRKDKLVGKTKANDDLSFANIVHMFESNDKSTCDIVNTSNMTNTLTRTYSSDSEIKTDRNEMICNPKKTVSSTVSLNGLSLAHRPNLSEQTPSKIDNKNTNGVQKKYENNKNVVHKSILTASTSLGLENNENKHKITQIKQKSLSPVISSKVTGNKYLLHETTNISSASTLKISNKENNKKSQSKELLDNICNKRHENETKVIENVKLAAYAQVNKSKKILQENKNLFLTDTLKAALKQPLPTGPPPKKPPRTFAHTPNSKSPLTCTKLDHTPEINNTSSTSTDTSLSEKLNECLTNALKAKTSESGKTNKATKIKSDPKLMLQKLENALLNNKIKSPKLPRKLKSTIDSASSAKPSTSSHQPTTQPNIYTCETPQKNLFPNCLPSLNCVSNPTSSNSYTKVTTTSNNSTTSMSTFFTDSNEQKQEPIYAEPFHFKTVSESPKLSRNQNKFHASSSSLHYMSNPVCEWTTTTDKSDGNLVPEDKETVHTSNSKSDNSVSFNESGPLTRHKLNLIMNNTYASPSPTDSDIDSIPSTPSSEYTSNSKRGTIKDLILNFEQKNQLEPSTLNNSATGKQRLAASTSWHGITEETQKELSGDSVEDRKKIKSQLNRKLTEIRKTYVRRVCSTLRQKPSDFKIEEKQLFECCLLVGLNVATLTPYIKNKFPLQYEVPPWVEHLCFPDASEWSAKLTTIPNIQSQDCQCYSLVITNDKGDRKFGYCRRVVPEETSVCLPLTYCIISSYRATGFYHKVIQELESRHGLPFALQEAFLEKLYKCKFPEPGESIHVPCLLKSLVVDSCKEMIESNKITNPDSVECIKRITKSGVYGQLNKVQNNLSDGNGWIIVDQVKSDETSDFRSPKITYGSTSKINEFERTSSEILNSVSNSEVVRRLNPNNTFTASSSKRNGQFFVNYTVSDNDTSEISTNNIKRENTPVNTPQTSDNSQYPLLNLPNNQLLNDCLIGDVVLKRPYDTRLEDVDLTMLFNTLGLTTLLQIFGSLLHERKVIFISNCLSKLSSCVEALQSILYPFSWQHTFIPVLSNNMLDILSAPLPIIAGVLASHITETLIIDEGIAVNLDTSTIVCYMGDESDIIPKRLQKGLTVALQLVTEATQSDDRSRNVLVSEAFVRMFVEVCGCYKQFIITKESGEKTFERELFVKHHQTKCVNLFLEWFSETAMFHNFIQSRLDSEPSESMFEQRCLELKSEKNSAALLKNSKVSHKMKFFSNKLFH